MNKQTVIQGSTLMSLLILSIGACPTGHPPILTSPVSAPHRDTVPISNTSGWAPRLSSGKWQYLIRDSSTISMTNDTTGHVEPIESTAIYALSIADSENVFILTSRVDSLSVNSHLPSKKAGESSEPLELHGVLSSQGHFTATGTAGSAPCTATGISPSSRLQELLITLPIGAIRVGDKWSDTSSTTICHGKIPLTQVFVRNYELMKSSTCQPGTVQVDRMVSNSLTSSSADSKNYLGASGSGTATSVLCLDRNTGLLLESDGQSHLELIVTTSRGKFPFTQNTTTHIESIDKS
jgi:hypothetical protein